MVPRVSLNISKSPYSRYKSLKDLWGSIQCNFETIYKASMRMSHCFLILIGIGVERKLVRRYTIIKKGRYLASPLCKENMQ